MKNSVWIKEKERDKEKELNRKGKGGKNWVQEQFAVG